MLSDQCTEHSAGVAAAPRNLVTSWSNYLVGPFTQSINNNWKEWLFPRNAKVASVTPVILPDKCFELLLKRLREIY